MADFRHAAAPTGGQEQWENSCCVLPHLQLASFLGHGQLGAMEQAMLRHRERQRKRQCKVEVNSLLIQSNLNINSQAQSTFALVMRGGEKKRCGEVLRGD